MKRIWAGGLCLSLIGLVAAANAQQPKWQPAAPRSLPVFPKATPVPMVPPAVGLGQPTAGSQPTTPRGGIVQAMARFPAAGLGQPVVRAQNSENTPPRRLAPLLGAEGEQPIPVWPADEKQASPIRLCKMAVAPEPAVVESLHPPQPLPNGQPSGVVEAPPAGSLPTYEGRGPLFAEDEVGAGYECGECAGGSCCCEALGGSLPRFYVGAEYLLWFTKGSRLPPLVTTTNANPFLTSGIIGTQGATILYGNDNVDYGPFSGGRVTAGMWIDECQTLGVEGSAFFLGEQTARFATDPASAFVIARPFLNASQNGTPQDVELNNAPNLVQGHLSVESPSRLWGYDVNLRRNLLANCASRLDLLVGYRYLDLREGLIIREDVLTAPDFSDNFPIFQANNPVLADQFNSARVGIVDSFQTHNQFYGGQVGTVFTRRNGRWGLDLRTKVGLGVTRQTVEINGASNFFFSDGSVVHRRGGLLALDTNIGRYSRNRFTVVPEIGLTIGYQLTDHIRLIAGYNFLYWSSVVRPGDQVDTVVNPKRIPYFSQINQGTAAIGPQNPNRPVFMFREKSYWAQGVTCGMEVTY